MKKLFFAAMLALLPLATTSAQDNSATAKATFAGGCFWCVEADFDKVDGVISTTSGYTGGDALNPSYRDVVSGRTGHAEAVEVVYDPSKVSYEELLQVFWLNIDPTVANRQFCDSGSQYRTAIYTHDAQQFAQASASAGGVRERLGEEVFTEIEAAERFYPAEDYHQDYYKKNPLRYRSYRTGCGRDRRLKKIWGGASEAFDPARLSQTQ
ncbi:MAG: peptide-methionine (S)-S-oxide reductase MsrA [Pseudomonadota bacterium]